MDVCYIQFVIFLIVLPYTVPVQSNLQIYESELTQNISSTSSNQQINATESVLISQTLFPDSYRVLKNITAYSHSSLDLFSPKALDELSILIQLIRNISLKPLDILSNKMKTSSKSLSDLLFNVSEVIPKTSLVPLNLVSKNSKTVEKISSKPLFDLILNMSEVITTSPAPLGLHSNKAHEQPEVNSTSSSVQEDSHGSILRRQGALKYHDILYSKPPNRYYAFQVATYKEGGTVTTTTTAPVSFNNSCDIDAFYCLKAYTTGVVCARTLYYVHHTFPNVCLMEYTNCFLHANEWHLLYMGNCISLPVRYGFYDYLGYRDQTYLKRIRVQENVNSLPIDLY